MLTTQVYTPTCEVLRQKKVSLLVMVSKVVVVGLDILKAGLSGEITLLLGCTQMTSSTVEEDTVAARLMLQSKE